MSHDEASWHLLADRTIREDSDEELLPPFTRETRGNGWLQFMLAGEYLLSDSGKPLTNVVIGQDKTSASFRRVQAAILSGLRSISIRKWMLLMPGIFTLAVVITLKLGEYSRRYHPMFKVSPSSLITALFLLTLIPILGCPGFSKLSASAQSRPGVARRSRRTVRRLSQLLSEV